MSYNCKSCHHAGRETIFLNSQLRHANVVQFMGSIIEPPLNCSVITEFMDSDLYKRLHNKAEDYKSLIWPQKISILIDIANGMAYLHKKDVIHRDLNSKNVMLTKNLQAKISDYGLAKMKATVSNIMTVNVGTPLWSK